MERIMSVQDNVATARRLLEQGFGDGDLSVVDDLVAPDLVAPDLVAPDFVEHQNGAQGTTGPAAVQGIVKGLHASLSDIRLTIEDIVAAGDDVWVRARATARNDKPIMGRPATGRDVEIDVVDILRFRDGKVVAHWGVADRQDAPATRSGRRFASGCSVTRPRAEQHGRLAVIEVGALDLDHVRKLAIDREVVAG
jgi:predicted ester cyclase